VLDIVLEEGVLTKEQVTELLKPEKMTQPARATID
jgi:aspartate ammonia-lyase